MKEGKKQTPILTEERVREIVRQELRNLSLGIIYTKPQPEIGRFFPTRGKNKAQSRNSKHINP
jgi:hypothetical protein